MQMQKTFFQRVDNNEIKTPQLYTYRLSPYDMDLYNVSTYLAQAILLEVCVHPKPGLVTRASNGSHSDMSILTFAMSSAVLSKAFKDLQEIGINHIGNPKELLNKVREYGKAAEQEMLRVTKGINTQRGILFAGGLLSAAAGYSVSNGIDKTHLLAVVKEMTAGLVNNELCVKKEKGKTAGEQLYEKYGITGIRGEVEQGFPSVLNKGVPALREAMNSGAALNDALVHTLLALITVVEDSNVIWRTDMETAQEVKRIAANIIEKGSVFTNEGREALTAAEKYFVRKRISPGGSADLLSITICLYLLENKEFPVEIF